MTENTPENTLETELILKLAQSDPQIMRTLFNQLPLETVVEMIKGLEMSQVIELLKHHPEKPLDQYDFWKTYTEDENLPDSLTDLIQELYSPSYEEVKIIVKWLKSLCLGKLCNSNRLDNSLDESYAEYLVQTGSPNHSVMNSLDYSLFINLIPLDTVSDFLYSRDRMQADIHKWLEPFSRTDHRAPPQQKWEIRFIVGTTVDKLSKYRGKYRFKFQFIRGGLVMIKYSFPPDYSIKKLYPFLQEVYSKIRWFSTPDPQFIFEVIRMMKEH